MLVRRGRRPSPLPAPACVWLSRGRWWFSPRNDRGGFFACTGEETRPRRVGCRVGGASCCLPRSVIAPLGAGQCRQQRSGPFPLTPAAFSFSFLFVPFLSFSFLFSLVQLPILLFLWCFLTSVPLNRSLARRPAEKALHPARRVSA